MFPPSALRLAAALLLTAANVVCAAPFDWPPPRKVDERRAAAAGIRVLESAHLRLFTDLPSSQAVDELPLVFSKAAPQWADYFGVGPQRVSQWQMQGYLIQDRAKFAALDLLPRENTEFANGFAIGYELWLVEQPTDYYRRHLLLHEGTHGFMLTHLGGCGPGWHMEGIAELLGTHAWEEGRLRMGVVPASRESSPMWGRIKLVRDAVTNRRALPLEAVLKIDNRRRLTTSDYAWTWTLAAMLDGQQHTRRRFRRLQEHVRDPDFDQKFRRLFADEWEDLRAQWQATLAALDYGYDFQRMAIQHQSSEPVTGDGATQIDVARGWQSTGWRLQAGRTYRITSEGRYQIAVDPASAGSQPWWCEPGGVTIRYHAGHPLGALMGALRPAGKRGDGPAHTAAPEQAAPSNHPTFSQPVRVGRQQVLRPRYDAVLYLRVNDSAAQLTDNRGSVQASITVD